VDGQDRIRRECSLEVYRPGLTDSYRSVETHRTSLSSSEPRSNCAGLTDNLIRIVQC
jgi:hypothetical protein